MIEGVARWAAAAITAAAVALGGCQPKAAMTTMEALKSDPKIACITTETTGKLRDKLVEWSGASKYKSQVQAGVTIKVTEAVLNAFDKTTTKATCNAKLAIFYSPALADLIKSHNLNPDVLKSVSDQTFNITYLVQPAADGSSVVYTFDPGDISHTGDIITGLDLADADKAQADADHLKEVAAATPIPHPLIVQIQGLPGPTDNNGSDNAVSCGIVGTLKNETGKDVSFLLRFEDDTTLAGYVLGGDVPANSATATLDLGKLRTDAGSPTAECPAMADVRAAIARGMKIKSNITTCVAGTETFDQCRDNLQLNLR
jgi:hypothetical protein